MYPPGGPATAHNWFGHRMDHTTGVSRPAKVLFLNVDGVAQNTSPVEELLTVATDWDIRVLGLGDTRRDWDSMAAVRSAAARIWDPGPALGGHETTWHSTHCPAAVARSAQVGGNTMGVHSSYSRTVEKLGDPRKLGIYAGVVLQGRKDPASGVSAPSRLAIISVYLPTESTRPSSLWRRIADATNTDPREYCFSILQDEVNRLHSTNTQVILGGDFNVPATSAYILNLMSACGMESVLDTHHQHVNTFSTYVQSDDGTGNTSRIDHCLASSGMATGGIISRSGIYKPLLARSRHRAVVIEVDMDRALNLHGPLPQPLPPPLRLLRAKDKVACAQFQDALDDLWSTRGMPREIQHLQSICGKRPPPLLVERLDALADTAMQLAMQANDTLNKYNYAPTKKFKNGYCPTTIRRAVTLRFLQHQLRIYNTRSEGWHHRIRAHVMHADRYQQGVRVTLREDLVTLGLDQPPASDSPAEWQIWHNRVTAQCKALLNELHGRKRAESRAKLTQVCAQRQQLYKDKKTERIYPCGTRYSWPHRASHQAPRNRPGHGGETPTNRP